MDELETKAREVLIEHEAIEECEVHKGVYVDNGDPEAVSKAYAAAAEMVKSGGDQRKIPRSDHGRLR